MSFEASEIQLSSIMPIENLKSYKIHLAVQNNVGVHPLDSFVSSFDEWKGWHKHRGSVDRFNRNFIFSVIDFYPQKGKWLFGGIFEVLSRHENFYEIELTNQYRDMIGRLKIDFLYTSRTRELLMERYYNEMNVFEILPKVYDGEPFRGYETVTLSFIELENIIKRQHLDWKAALENIYGIYQIIDKNTGKKYVGKACGGNGIWSRWAQYISNAHGGNNQLLNLISRNGFDYARRFYQFSLLEYMPTTTSDTVIDIREQYWKKVLLSQGEFGYNSN